MTVYLIRDLVHASEDAIRQLPLVHSIQFDDGEVMQVRWKETFYSWFFWELFQPFPNTRILKHHHVKTVLKGRVLNADTHRTLCTNIFKSLVQDEGLSKPYQKEPVLEHIYRRISTAMNELSLETEENVTGLDVLDFIQIAKHPKVEELRAETFQDPRKIKYAYNKTIDIIEEEPEFKDNGLAKAVRAKMVKSNQVTQCVVFRGYGTEVDGGIFNKPIWGNYTFGNTNLYDFVADSRTAAKSHYYSDTALKDSEYMARKFQLFCASVEHVVYEDCGSVKYMPWIVQGEKKDSSGETIYRGDLPFLVGKEYLEEGSTELKVIDGSEKHLIGRQIKFRSVLYCNTANPHHVCHRCVGKLSENISRFANIGHLGSVSTTKDLTQNILSIKHVNTSSTMLKVFLGDHESKFMNVGVEGTAFYLNQSLSSVSPKLTVAHDEAQGLVDLEVIDDIDHVSLARISEVKRILLTTTSHGRQFDVQLDVTQKSKASMMSRELLCYLKVHGWKTDDQNRFVFDMSHWNYSWPLFVMPNKEESFVDLAAAVDTLVRSSQKMLQKRLIKDAPAVLLQELFELVNSKLQINILSFEIIVYALMVESTKSYAMARNAPNPVLGVAELLTNYRSLGNALAYQKQNDTLQDPFNFFQGKRPDSPMDVFLAPREVVEAYPGQ